VGVEALIRWIHPERGIVSPLEFIPLAEETGMIISIGEWVLRTACIQNKEWQEAGLSPMIMAVNLSARQLYQPNLIELVQHILEETGLAPEYLELEITESMTMKVHQVLPILQELKRIGVYISLDDFGTGYSSLYYLKEFPIDKIKIDQSFVRNCTTDTKDSTIVKTIIAMAHQLKVVVVAEGVESKDHLIFLQQNLCNKGQGYFFSQPLLPEELVQRYDEIEQIIHRQGIPQELNRQKWLEKALEHARQELRDTVRQQQGVIFKFREQNGKFIHTLCDGELLYRLGFTSEHIVGKELHDFLPSSDAEIKLQYYRRAWEGEENVTYERQYNGIWYLATLRPIRRGGQIVEVIGSCVDITKRKESEERYQRLFNLCPEPIVVHSQGIIKNINQSGAEVFGFSNPKELLGKSILEFVHPDSRKKVNQRLQSLQHGRERHIELLEHKMVRQDGTTFFAEGTAIGMMYDGEPVIEGIFRDITARKQAEEILRQSEEKYRLIAENMQDLIGVLDTNGVVQYASPSHETVLGFSPEVYEGNPAFDMVHPDDIPHIQQEYMNMVLSKTPCRVEFRYQHAKGGWVYVEAFGTPVLDEQGEVQHLVVVARDISERKKAEEFILKSDKLSAVGKLAAGLAQEIRNPLTSIKGFLQLMQKDVKPNYIDIMLAEIDHMEGILKEFLTLSKPHFVQMKSIDINALIQKVIKLFSTQTILKNVAMMQELDVGLPLIRCDENQIKQVFINVLQNAVDSMPNGGTIHIQTMKDGTDYIKITFMDQGIGIPEERLKRIGEPFYSTKEKGTGLGLMISHKIVQEHGGTINFESIVNQGTKVDIVLPIQHSFITELP